MVSVPGIRAAMLSPDVLKVTNEPVNESEAVVAKPDLFDSRIPLGVAADQITSDNSTSPSEPPVADEPEPEEIAERKWTDKSESEYQEILEYLAEPVEDQKEYAKLTKRLAILKLRRPAALNKKDKELPPAIRRGLSDDKPADLSRDDIGDWRSADQGLSPYEEARRTSNFDDADEQEPPNYGTVKPEFGGDVTEDEWEEKTKDPPPPNEFTVNEPRAVLDEKEQKVQKVLEARRKEWQALENEDPRFLSSGDKKNLEIFRKEFIPDYVSLEPTAQSPVAAPKQTEPPKPKPKPKAEPQEIKVETWTATNKKRLDHLTNRPILTDVEGAELTELKTKLKRVNKQFDKPNASEEGSPEPQEQTAEEKQQRYKEIADTYTNNIVYRYALSLANPANENNQVNTQLIPKKVVTTTSGRKSPEELKAGDEIVISTIDKLSKHERTIGNTAVIFSISPLFMAGAIITLSGHGGNQEISIMNGHKIPVVKPIVKKTKTGTQSEESITEVDIAQLHVGNRVKLGDKNYEVTKILLLLKDNEGNISTKPLTNKNDSLLSKNSIELMAIKIIKNAISKTDAITKLVSLSEALDNSGMTTDSLKIIAIIEDFV